MLQVTNSRDGKVLLKRFIIPDLSSFKPLQSKASLLKAITNKMFTQCLNYNQTLK